MAPRRPLCVLLLLWRAERQVCTRKRRQRDPTRGVDVQPPGQLPERALHPADLEADAVREPRQCLAHRKQGLPDADLPQRRIPLERELAPDRRCRARPVAQRDGRKRLAVKKRNASAANVFGWGEEPVLPNERPVRNAEDAADRASGPGEARPARVGSEPVLLREGANLARSVQHGVRDKCAQSGPSRPRRTASRAARSDNFRWHENTAVHEELSADRDFCRAESDRSGSRGRV
mmetsp:Transcript_15909/g.39375  ORF Transcript_15909/g.39375 Transcript_15909/m.39375 type:complete len:234 (+) Transcript_15909:1356-2057(+)